MPSARNLLFLLFTTVDIQVTDAYQDMIAGAWVACQMT